MAVYVRKTKRDESEAARSGEGSETRNRRVWLGSWVLGNSRRPPNELFSSLPIYFCSLFNQPPLVTLRPPSSFLASTFSNETPKVLFLRCSSSESTLERGLSPRTAWINGRRERHGEDIHIYVVNIRTAKCQISFGLISNRDPPTFIYFVDNDLTKFNQIYRSVLRILFITSLYVF